MRKSLFGLLRELLILSFCVVLLSSCTEQPVAKGRIAPTAPGGELLPGKPGSLWFYIGPNLAGSQVVLVLLLVSRANLQRFLDDFCRGVFDSYQLSEVSELVANLPGNDADSVLCWWQCIKTERITPSMSFADLTCTSYISRIVEVCNIESRFQPQLSEMPSEQFKLLQKSDCHKLGNRVHYAFVEINSNNHRELYNPVVFDEGFGKFTITDEFHGSVVTPVFERGIGLVGLFENVKPSEIQAPRSDKKRYRNAYYSEKSLMHRLVYYRIVSEGGAVVEFPEKVDIDSGDSDK